MSRTSCIAAAALALLSACASGPSLERAYEVRPDDEVVVGYEQRETGLRQTLLTESIAEPSEFYSSQASDPLAKVLSSADMQFLLDALATFRFFEHARPAAAAPDATAALHVQINGDARVWPKVPTMSPDELADYHRAWAAFQDIYNATTSFHVGRDDNDVLREGERIRARNARQLQKARAGQAQGQV